MTTKRLPMPLAFLVCVCFGTLWLIRNIYITETILLVSTKSADDRPVFFATVPTHGTTIQTRVSTGTTTITPTPSTATLATNDASRPKILIYISTVFSEGHQSYFQCCWPRLVKSSNLIQQADIIIYSNNLTQIDRSALEIVDSLFAGSGDKKQERMTSFQLKFASPAELDQVTKYDKLLNRKEYIHQVGANLAIQAGFENGWFRDYDWVVRINPDVLIRNSKWLLDTMTQNPNGVDGIFVNCSTQTDAKVHADFFAVRPDALRKNAFAGGMMGIASTRRTKGIGMPNHEQTAYREFSAIIERGRYQMLPDTKDSNTLCRVRGPHSPVYHAHDSCLYNKGDAIDKAKCTALDKYERLGHVIE